MKMSAIVLNEVNEKFLKHFCDNFNMTNVVFHKLTYKRAHNMALELGSMRLLCIPKNATK